MRTLLPLPILILSLLLAHTQAAGQTVAAQPTRFGIIDNSFLVEEAFNQEPSVFQNILSFTRSRGGEWGLVFTQEWPAPNMTHQLSYTIPISQIDRQAGVGDVLINYRFQAISESSARPAFAPRLSMILPTGDSRTGLGDGVFGLQVNLPFSKQRGNLYFHGNTGFTFLPDVESALSAGRMSLFSPTVGGSAIWQVSPILNFLFEALAEFKEELSDGGSVRSNRFIVSSGLRRAWNISDKQIVLGAAGPVTFDSNRASLAALAYFSYEARFRK